LGNMEIGLSASNLLNNKHQEHPQGDEVGRFAVLFTGAPLTSAG